MIDVPVQVKEALKEGRLKKNYRFLVENMSGWMTVGSFKCIDLSFPTGLVGDDYKYIIEESGQFRFHINEANYDTYTCYYRTTSNGAWSTLQASDRNTWEYTSTGYVQIEIKRPTESASDIIAVEKYSNGFTRTIDNNNLVSESVNIDERMCSGDVLKFGLCEGSSLEFQYFDFPNITGKRIQAFIDVDYGESTPYSIPMGFFTVKKCSRQASTGIIKATAYNKLQSEYLDAKANEGILEIVDQGEYGYDDKVSLYTIIAELLDGYRIERASYYTTPIEYRVPMANVSSIRICQSDGTLTNNYLYLDMLTLGVNLNHEDFYKFDLLTASLKEYAREHIWSDFEYLYTKVGNTVYTINQLANSDYSGGWALAGRIELRKNVNINTFFFRRKGGQADFTTEDYSECYKLEVTIPVGAVYGTTPPTANVDTFLSLFNQRWGSDYQFFNIFQKTLTDFEKIRITKVQAEAFSDVSLRNLQSAVFESACQFGQLSRVTDLFSGVELNHSRLYPAANLYPSNSLVPLGAALSTYKSMYSKLWADEGNIHKWRYLIITYKGLNENDQEEDFKLQRTINADGTDDYNMSDNWIFRNLIWNGSDVGNYADAMVSKMRDVTWFPFELWCPGLPYLETGDEIEIELNENSYTSYILQRQLKGIQNIQDTYINGTLDIF